MGYGKGMRLKVAMKKWGVEKTRRHVESSKGKRASNMTVCIHLRETAVDAWGFWWAEERKLVNLLLLHYKPHRMRLVDVTLCYKCRTFRGLCVCPCTCICLAHHWASQNGWTDAFWSADSCGPKEPCFRRAARWRHVANTTELKRHVCGGRVAFCQITLTTYVWFSGDVAYLSWTWYGGRIIQQETGDSRRCRCCCCCTLLQLLRAVVACLSRASAAEVSSLSGDFDADSRERQRIPLSATTVYFRLNLPHTRTSFMSMDARIDYVPV